jgi:hypothetical protein
MTPRRSRRRATGSSKLQSLLSPGAAELLKSSGKGLIENIGIDVVRGVVHDVLTGRNLRDSTELLTRRRLASLSLATLVMFLRGEASQKNFVESLPNLATQMLQSRRLAKSDRWFAQWILGLTDKAFQNVLRDDPNALVAYRDRYIEACSDVIAACREEYGEVRGSVHLDCGVEAELSWVFLAYLMNTIGAQTLAIRGSEKSAYGKLFEKLVLGSLLHILGFQYVTGADERQARRVFWLSSKGERRESDATLLYEAGKGIRFDIGFIGRGNPEISLDKVTRFEREIEYGRSKWYMATFIIVDRIGEGSRIESLARRVDGTIIQMSMRYWPQLVARELHRVLGYSHEFMQMKESQLSQYLREKLNAVPLERFVSQYS